MGATSDTRQIYRLRYISGPSNLRKIAETEFVIGQNDWYQVLATLGLPPKEASDYMAR
jgi:hypothetical protein